MQERVQRKANQEKSAGTYYIPAGASKTRSDEFKTYVLWGLIGLAAAGTAGYFGYKLVRKIISNAAQNGALDTNEPAYYAKKIKAGIDNNNMPGTDTVAIRSAFVEIPTKEVYRKVADNYKKQYGNNLYKDLETHLHTTEMQELTAIYSIKPERSAKEAPTYDPTAWAIRLNAAVNYEQFGFLWGTDEEAIKQVFVEIPTQKAWQDVQQAYYDKYGVDLDTELDEDLSQSEFDYRAFIARKPIQ